MVMVPLPTQKSWLIKRSEASHSGESKGSKHSLQTQLGMNTTKNRRQEFQKRLTFQSIEMGYSWIASAVPSKYEGEKLITRNTRLSKNRKNDR